jgi:O-acetyl-ADP-ribose deacetylase (regulator of RNase III)
MEKLINNTKIGVIKGDITKIRVDAIVNAANDRLQHGGGVAGAIVCAGGWVIQEESDRIGFVPVGNAAITTAGKLPAKFVIHTVGPRMGEGDEDEKLKNATLNSLKLADENNVKSIAIPAVSAGIFGFPKDRCAKIMVENAVLYARGETKISEIIFVLFNDDLHRLFLKELEKY